MLNLYFKVDKLELSCKNSTTAISSPSENLSQMQYIASSELSTNHFDSGYYIILII